MDRMNSLKNNQPELLSDFNGNPVQGAWMLGGKTIEVLDNGSFVAESTLMRICNPGTALVKLKLQNVDYSQLPYKTNGQTDEGTPILPGTTCIYGVYLSGQEYSVEGGDIYVSFVYDRRTPTL